MRPRFWIVVAVCGVVLVGGAVAHAEHPGDAPYVRSYELGPSGANHARLIVPARPHPEVEVSRELAAQPVHPWKAKVQIGSLTTHIDPLQRLRKEGRGIDDSHYLMEAQRLHLRLRGVTTSQLNELRNASRAATDRPIPANRARIVVRPQRAAERPPIEPTSTIPARPDRPNRAKIVRGR